MSAYSAIMAAEAEAHDALERSRVSLARARDLYIEWLAGAAAANYSAALDHLDRAIGQLPDPPRSSGSAADKPCPFCGGAPGGVDGDQTARAVGCYCGANGPIHETDLQAKNAWNNRRPQ